MLLELVTKSAHLLALCEPPRGGRVTEAASGITEQCSSPARLPAALKLFRIMARNLPIHSTAAMKTAAAAEFAAFVDVVFHVGQQKTEEEKRKITKNYSTCLIYVFVIVFHNPQECG